jgi:uncharacterized protein (TIGR03435 family)
VLDTLDTALLGVFYPEIDYLMMRAFAGVSFLALICGALFGQSTATPPPTPSELPPAFETADVHASAHSTRTYMSGGVLRGGRYDLRYATLVDLIATAYGIDNDKVLGGPSWLETDRFDIIAKAPPTTSTETLHRMLQALLADRFKLVIHKDTKPLPAYSLTVGKGRPKLKEADGSGNKGCPSQAQNPVPGTVPYAMATCRNVTMDAFAQNLRDMASAYINNPVVDSTGLKGSWDFDLKWTPRALLSQAGADGITIFDAVDKQLGLKLELQKLPTPVIVVDSVNQKPTGNPPGVTENLPPPPPAEFEVADIKPSQPGAGVNGAIQPGGRINLQSFTLKMLIDIAWDINGDEMLVGAPKWLDSDRFDIVAKASTTGPSPDVDFDDLRLMVRALLADRFKLATHTEDREISAYTLVAAKPKLTKADPLNRTGCKEGPAPGAKDLRDVNPVLARLLTCQNMTMAQFAEQLPSLASGYIHSPVMDATGIEGAWDFTLNFSPIGLFQSAGVRVGDPGQPAGAAPAASDPSGALSLFDAVSKQLGLKLEMHKRSVPVLVIDHVEQKPTEN